MNPGTKNSCLCPDGYRRGHLAPWPHKYANPGQQEFNILLVVWISRENIGKVLQTYLFVKKIRFRCDVLF